MGRIVSEKTRRKLSKTRKRLFKEGKIKLSSSCFQKGEKHRYWKGGRYHSSKGYIRVYKPNHPNANYQGYMAEHRLVMEKKIGRYLMKSETVHHINGIKDDNRIDNLIIFGPNKHMKFQRIINKVCKTDLISKTILKIIQDDMDKCPNCKDIYLAEQSNETHKVVYCPKCKFQKWEVTKNGKRLGY